MKFNFYLVFLLVFAISFVSADLSSDNYSMDAVIAPGSEINSSSYTSTATIESYGGNTSSSTYETFVGFWKDFFKEKVETPVITPEPPEDTGSGGGGGGGGGGGATTSVDFELKTELYETTVALGRIEEGSFDIENNGDSSEYFTITVEGLDGILSVDSNVNVDGKSSKTIEFRVSAPKDTGVYTGKILVSSGSLVKEILIIVNVKTEKSLFDVILTLPWTQKTINPGENIKPKIDLIEMGYQEYKDVTLYYEIKDFDGNIYYQESETIAVADKKTFEREFYTAELESNDYVLAVELVYPDGVATASSHFQIKDPFELNAKSMAYGSIVIAMLIVILALGLGIRSYKKKKAKL